MGKTTKAKARKPRLTPASREAKLAVAQVYWNNDQEYKLAESKRTRARDLALVAIGKNETVGPVVDNAGTSHWLTHGEKERVEMDALALWNGSYGMSIGEIYSVFRVDTAALKERFPKAYEGMLKQRLTTRTKHDCLTWSTKARRA